MGGIGIAAYEWTKTATFLKGMVELLWLAKPTLLIGCECYVQIVLLISS